RRPVAMCTTVTASTESATLSLHDALPIYAGLAASAMGFALGNKLLIVAGALDGASGFILALVMCKAMNRSFANVMFGGFGATAGSAAGGKDDRVVRSASAEEAAMQMENASSVIIVPGYG